MIIHLETHLSSSECLWWAVPLCWQCLEWGWHIEEGGLWKPVKDGSCPVVVAPGLAGDRGSVWFLGQLSPKDVVHRQTPCVSREDTWDTPPPQTWGTCRLRKAGKRDLRRREAISCSKLVLWAPPLPGNKAQIDFSPLSGTQLVPPAVQFPLKLPALHALV